LANKTDHPFYQLFNPGMTEVNNSWFLVTVRFFLMFSGQMLTNL